MVWNSKKISVCISLIVILLVIIVSTIFIVSKEDDKTSILGNWYAWHEDLQKEVLTFNENDTYQSSKFYFDEKRDKYRMDKDIIFLEGLAFYQELVLEQQDGEFFLRAIKDEGLMYYRSEEQAQTEYMKGITVQDDFLWESVQKEQNVQEEQSIQEERTTEQVAKDLLGPWDSEFGVQLNFGYNDDYYFYVLDTPDGDNKTGEYRVMSPTTMVLVDSETQKEELIEFSLTSEPSGRGNIKIKTFVSDYFQWAGKFVSDPSLL